MFWMVLAAALDRPPSSRNPTWLFVAALAVALWMLPHMTDMGFGRSWGNRARVAAVAIGVGLLAVDFLYGRWWAPPLAWYSFLLVEVVFGLFTLSLVVGAVAATPG